MTMKTFEPKSEAIAASRDLTNRPRRLRRTESIRSLVRETAVRPEDLIYPLFYSNEQVPAQEAIYHRYLTVGGTRRM